MATYVREAAQQAASDTRRHSVKASTVRKYARRDASRVNSSLHPSMVKVRGTTGGARISATNPWTHQTISYTLKASGKKVTVTKGR
jgi:hypothetical protein